MTHTGSFVGSSNTNTLLIANATVFQSVKECKPSWMVTLVGTPVKPATMPHIMA